MDRHELRIQGTLHLRIVKGSLINLWTKLKFFWPSKYPAPPTQPCAGLHNQQSNECPEGLEKHMISLQPSNKRLGQPNCGFDDVYPGEPRVQLACTELSGAVSKLMCQYKQAHGKVRPMHKHEHIEKDIEQDGCPRHPSSIDRYGR